MTAEAIAQELEAAGVRMARPPWRHEQARTHWRAWLVVALIVAAGLTLIVLAYRPPAPQYLSPESVGPTGTHALADLLGELGRTVQTQTSVSGARAAAAAGTTLVITSPVNLAPADLRALARVRADVLLVEPDVPALAAIAPGIELAGPPAPVAVTQPGCALRAARLAGSVKAGGVGLAVLTTSSPVQQCYQAAFGPTLVQTRVRGRLVTVLSSGALLTNAELSRQGNAALAIDLLPTRRVVWLLPPVSATTVAVGSSGRSFWSLVPPAAYLVAAQLGFALLLAIGWRSRRLGPLVAERLPVVVHAAETVLGHGQLYQSRHARGRAAGELRAVLLGRICQAAGLPGRADASAVVDAVAQRSAADPERIRDLLYGPAPRSDAALATLARDLDDLAREVGVN